MGVRIGGAIFCAMVLGTAQADGGLLPVSVNVTPEGSDYRYTYSVVLQSDAVVRTGDFFTVYDFAGFNPGTNQQPANFTYNAASSGANPPGVLAADDPAISNLTWTYTGATDLHGPNALGAFSAVSDYSRRTTDHFTGQTHRQVDGHLNSNITDTYVPVPAAPCHVPEPTSLVLLLLGIPGAVVARAVRKR